MTPSGSMASWLEDVWLDRYLDSLLAQDEQAWFEQYALDKPSLLQRIDTDTRLRQAIEAHRTNPEQLMLPTETDHAARDITQDHAAIHARRTHPTRAHRGAARWLAVAAALVVGFGTGGILMRSEAPAIIANPAHVVYDSLRGEAMPPRSEQGGDSEYVLIQVAIPPSAEDVTLHVDSGIDAKLVPDANGLASFLVRRSLLASSKTAQVNFTVDGRRQSHPLKFAELNVEK